MSLQSPHAARIGMEQIQRPEVRPWISPETITARHFLKQCNENNLNETVNEANMTFVQFVRHSKIRMPAAILDSVVGECEPGSQLACEEEQMLLEGGVNNDEARDWLSDVSLESVKYLRQHPGTRPWTVDYERCSSRECASGARPAPGAVALPPPKTLDAVIVLQIFRPTNPAEGQKSSLVVDMEIEVLSHQTLLDVRRVISCASDMSRNSCQPDGRTSAYFFINNTFYNDMRPGSVDYSKTIIDWSLEPGRGLGAFSACDMAAAELADLSFQPGFPYLYVHQGDCEHLVVFTDVRLVTDRSFCLTEFPKLKPIARRNQIKCEMCRTNVAKWTTRENVRVVADPSFFCDECYETFNFQARHQKVGSFQSQTYIDKSVLL